MKKLLYISLLIAPVLAHAQSYFGEKGEPVRGILIGAGQSDAFTDKKDYAGSFNRFAQAVGLTPPLFMDYIPASNSLNDMSFPIKLEGISNRFKTIRANLPKGARLQLGITFNGTGSLNATAAKAPISKEIAAGKYDANLLAIGDGLASLNDTCYVRLGHEFDLKSNNQLGIDYIKAYKHAYNILSSKSSKIVFVWCSSGGSGARWGDSLQMLKSYPGDAFVNWMGADVFDYKEWGSVSMNNFLAFSAAHKKPFMVGETTPRGIGVLTGKIAWDKWFAPMLATLAANPVIKAVCYINWDWKAEDARRYNPGWGNWGDARIEKSDYISNAFKSGIKKLNTQIAPTIYDTTYEKVVYPLLIKVSHDSTVYKDSLRIKIVPRSAAQPIPYPQQEFEMLHRVAAILNRQRAK